MTKMITKTHAMMQKNYAIVVAKINSDINVLNARKQNIVQKYVK